jgi:hypothetical protein
LRPRLKRVLIDLAEDITKTREERLAAAEQLVNMLAVDANRSAARDRRASKRDKALLKQLRQTRLEEKRVREAKEKERRKFESRIIAPKPQPVPVGPNPLGV